MRLYVQYGLKFYAKSDDIFKKDKSLWHYHIIKNNAKDPHKIKRLDMIFKALYHNPIGKDIKSHWWQLGIRGSMRIFGIYDGYKNVFYPLICDWYHLMSSNPKYNGIDLRHLTFNPKELAGKYQIYRRE